MTKGFPQTHSSPSYIVSFQIIDIFLLLDYFLSMDANYTSSQIRVISMRVTQNASLIICAKKIKIYLNLVDSSSHFYLILTDQTNVLIRLFPLIQISVKEALQNNKRASNFKKIIIIENKE